MMGNVNIPYEEGMTNRGNWYRIKEVMKRAKAGEEITVGFLGGSITQGSLSSLPTTCYAYLVYEWWKETFQSAKINFVNAGIGGTTSQFGVARVEADLLSKQPDFVVVEFSVNDDNTPFYRETYEGLVRRIYADKIKPAVMLVHNVFYETGTNAQDQHGLIGRYYELPCVSMKNCVYYKVADKSINSKNIAPDDLHPNDAGHKILARLVTTLLDKIYVDMENAENPSAVEEKLPESMTLNEYEASVRYQNYNCTPTLEGFLADKEEQSHITDIFKRGWTSKKEGDSISFEIGGSGLAVQYRKSVKHPSCIATAVIDGEKEVILDSNFEETWGDCLYLENLLVHGEDKIHTIKVTITKTFGEETVPFYLVSVIGSRSKEEM